MSTLPSRIRDPFAGQFESRQHNAMDAVLWKAVERHFHSRPEKQPNGIHGLTTFRLEEPNATFSASLASAMEALGLELTTKP